MTSCSKPEGRSAESWYPKFQRRIPPSGHVNKILSVISDKNKLIYVYCLSGSRSDVVVNIMKQSDYMNVFSMTSGLLMWRFKKYQLTV